MKEKKQSKNKVPVETEASDRRLDVNEQMPDILKQQGSRESENGGFDFLVHSIDPYSIKSPQE